VGDLDVFVITAANASLRLGGKVDTPRVLPKTREPTGRVIRFISNIANRP
jgi:hypothetical protein